LAQANFFIHITYLFILFFIGYTYAKSPSDYCNNIESPPPYLYFVDKNGKLELYLNSEYNQSLAPPSSVNQEEFLSIIDETASISDIDKDEVLDID